MKTFNRLRGVRYFIRFQLLHLFLASQTRTKLTKSVMQQLKIASSNKRYTFRHRTLPCKTHKKSN